MGDGQDRLSPLVQVCDELFEQDDGAVVLAGGGLVQDDDRGVHREDRGEGDPFALAERQMTGMAVRLPGQTGDLQCPLREGGPAVGREAEVAGPKPTSLATVAACSWSSGFWNTKPTLRASSAISSPAASRPSTVTVPDVGRAMPIRCRASVLLPAPLGPTTATRSPALTVSETSASAVVPFG